MEELREKVLSILDIGFQMVEKEKKSSTKRLIFNMLYGEVALAYDLKLLTFEEWGFLLDCLNVYKVEIFPQEENKHLQTMLDSIKDGAREKELDYYDMLGFIDDVLDELYGSHKYIFLSKEEISMKLYEKVLSPDYCEEWE